MREPVDLVVLDLMLPGVTGEAVLGAIRERGDTPVLIASAKRSDLERISGLRMGADDYLAKPFNPHELTARVAAILRRSRGEDRRPTTDGGARGRRPRASCRSTAAGSSSTPASRRLHASSGAGERRRIGRPRAASPRASSACSPPSPAGRAPS